MWQSNEQKVINSTINNFDIFCFLSFRLGYLNSIIQLMADFVIQKIFRQTYQPITVPSVSAVNTQTSWQQQPNNLITNANQMAEANFDFTVKQ